MDNRMKQVIYDCMVSMEAINSLLVKKGIYTEAEREKKEEEIKQNEIWAETQDTINRLKVLEKKLKNTTKEDFMSTIFSAFDINEQE